MSATKKTPSRSARVESPDSTSSESSRDKSAEDPWTTRASQTVDVAREECRGWTVAYDPQQASTGSAESQVTKFFYGDEAVDGFLTVAWTQKETSTLERTEMTIWRGRIRHIQGERLWEVPDTGLAPRGQRPLFPWPPESRVDDNGERIFVSFGFIAYKANKRDTLVTATACPFAFWQPSTTRGSTHPANDNARASHDFAEVIAKLVDDRNSESSSGKNASPSHSTDCRRGKSGYPRSEVAHAKTAGVVCGPLGEQGSRDVAQPATCDHRGVEHTTPTSG
jgi:hypothetical protein